MRTLVRESLIAALIGSLVCMPALGSPSAGLGMVVQAQDARLGSAPAAGGATVFTGDTIETGTNGSLRMRVSTGQLYLLASSVASLTSTENGVSAMLTQGTVGFTSTGKDAIELRADNAVLRATSTATTHAQVSVLGPRELIVSNYRGALQLEVSGEHYAIPENTAYRVVLQPENSSSQAQDQDQTQGPGPKGVGVKTVRRTHATLVLLGAAGAGVLLGYGIYRWTLSPSKPTP